MAKKNTAPQQEQNPQTQASETTKKAATQPSVTEAKLAALEKVVEKQSTDISALQEENKVLKEAQSATPIKEATAPPKKPEISSDPFKVEGKKYLLKFARFNIKGLDNVRKDFTAEQACEDEALLAHIVKNYKSLVTEVK